MAPRLIRPERLKSHTACEKRWLRQLPPYQESTNHSCLLEQKVGITATSTNLQLKNSASWTPLNLHRTQKWVLPGKRKLTGSFWTSWSRSSKFLFFKKSFCLFVYLFGLQVACGMWDLSSPPGIKPVPPAVKAQSLNHWTTREAPFCLSLASDSFGVFFLLQTDTPGCLST